jgi:hypothetical protein
VEIKGGQPDFTVYLMDEAPYKGGKTISYGKKIEARKYQFSEIAIQIFMFVYQTKKILYCVKRTPNFYLQINKIIIVLYETYE